MKIGMEFRDTTISGIDFSHVEDGNPGCGGTQFEFALLAHHLLKLNKGYEIVFFHLSDNCFEEGCKSVKLSSLQDMPRAAKEENVDVFLFWSAAHDDAWYKALEKNGLTAIAWAHNFLSYGELCQLRSCCAVKRVVCVSREQYELLCGEDIFPRCTAISNMFDFVPEKRDRSEALRSNIVCCMGALIKAKGFHLLAKHWKAIVRKVSNAQLYVLGTGKLYQANAVMGNFGLAEASYEKLFMKYLTDKNGQMLPSVHFLGNVGAEKNEIFRRSKVGVVNPNGVESFCIAALEKEAEGVPVCSRRANGLLVSVSHKKTGLLSRSSLGLKRDVLRLLQDDDLNKKMGEAAVDFAAGFHGDMLVTEWDALFDSVVSGRETPVLGISGNLLSRGKIFRRALYYLRRVPILRWLPTPYHCAHFIHTGKRILVRIKNFIRR